MPQKRRNSAVSNYLRLKCVNGDVHDRSHAVCRIYKIELKCHRGTNSLINHLSSKHRLEYSKATSEIKTTGCRRFANDHDWNLLFSTSQYHVLNMYYFYWIVISSQT